MTPSSDLAAFDRTSSTVGRSAGEFVPLARTYSASDLAIEVNRRLTNLGSGVRAEVDLAPRERTHLILRGPPASRASSAPPWEELVRIDALPVEREAAVSEVLAAVESKNWEPVSGSTLRLARSSVWCDPR